MTLGQLFDTLSQNPALIIFYFVALPLSALLGLLLGSGQGHASPWKYFYCAIVYLACVPGIFSITLSLYQFLFERIPVTDLDVFTQVLPILSMFLTLFLVIQNVSLEEVPGFGKLSGLMMLILVLFAFMWILDKTRIIVFTGFPFYLVIILMVAFFVLVRFGINKMIK